MYLPPEASWAVPGDWFDLVAEKLPSGDLKALKGVCREWRTAIRRRHRVLGPYWFPKPELVRVSTLGARL